MNKAIRTCASSFLLFVLAVAAGRVAGQSLPEGWQELEPQEFLDSVASLQLDESDRQLVAAHSAGLLQEGSLLTPSNYGVSVSLFQLAQPALSAEEIAGLANRLSEQSGQASQLSFQDIRQRLELMYLAGVPHDARSAETAAWIESNPANLDSVPARELAWLYNSMSYPHLKSGSFSVSWSGTVKAPRDGAYVFSISPINVNDQWQSFFIRNSWTVTIGDQQVLAATPEAWASEGQAIELAAGASTPIRVEATFEVSRPAVDAIHAMLFWQGPGLVRQVVPESALRSPDGTQPGLEGDYTVTLGDAPEAVARIDPAIDFAWITNRRVINAHPAALQKLRSHVWERCMDTEFLARSEAAQQDADLHPLLYDLLLVECLSSSQRQAFLEHVLERPAFLQPLNARQATALYEDFRFGADEVALDVFGTWAQLHGDDPPELPASATRESYFTANRHWYHDFARGIAVQLPDHMTRLEEGWLEREDGTCALPAAYSLAYCYQDSGQLEQWLAKLSERLEDPGLVGNARVNWLIAMAFAQELRNADPNFFTAGQERLQAGRGWLDEAILIAESEPVRLRALQEVLAREVAFGWDQQVSRRIENESASFSLPESQQVLDRLSAAVAAIASQRAEGQAALAGAAEEAYVSEVSRRQSQASSNGDAAAADRYGELIGSTPGVD